MRYSVAVVALACVMAIGACQRWTPISGELKVCLASDDAPRSVARSQSGFDVEVGRLLARELSHAFLPVWLPAAGRSEIESTDVSFSALLQGRCDVQFSVSGKEAIEQLSDRLVLTDPYYGAAFEVVGDSKMRELSDWQQARIAVRANSLAHIVVDKLKINWTMKMDTSEIVSAVESDEVDGALVWEPNLSAYQVAINKSFNHPSVLKWNQHIAMGVNGALIAKLNAVLRSPNVQREILKLLAEDNIPVHAPFKKVYRTADLKLVGS